MGALPATAVKPLFRTSESCLPEETGSLKPTAMRYVTHCRVPRHLVPGPLASGRQSQSSTSTCRVWSLTHCTILGAAEGCPPFGWCKGAENTLKLLYGVPSAFTSHAVAGVGREVASAWLAFLSSPLFDAGPAGPLGVDASGPP